MMEPEAVKGKDVEEAVEEANKGYEYDPHRIPSSVFAANQANWSGESNDSLFSIQMGNGGSGSFNNAAAAAAAAESRSPEVPHLAPLMEVSSLEESTLQSTEFSVNQSPSATKPRNPAPRISDSSTKSFAFPVLASGNGMNDASVKIVPEKPKIAAEKPVEVEPQPQQKPELELEPEPQTRKKWLSCFSCSC